VGNHAEILRMWQLLGSYLNRRQRSLWDVAEAEAIGCGGGVLLAGITGLSVQAITTQRVRLRLTKSASAESLAGHHRLRRVHGAGISGNTSPLQTVEARVEAVHKAPF
jgi:hypothetical protein